MKNQTEEKTARKHPLNYSQFLYQVSYKILQGSLSNHIQSLYSCADKKIDII